MDFWRSGTGWRLGYRSSPGKGLVGADRWAVELSLPELEDFCRLSLRLASTMSAMAETLVDQEKVECDLSSELIYLRAEGFPQSWALYFQLLLDRRAEGMWQESAIAGLMGAIVELRLYL